MEPTKEAEAGAGRRVKPVTGPVVQIDEGGWPSVLSNRLTQGECVPHFQRDPMPRLGFETPAEGGLGTLDAPFPDNLASPFNKQ